MNTFYLVELLLTSLRICAMMVGTKAKFCAIVLGARCFYAQGEGVPQGQPALTGPVGVKNGERLPVAITRIRQALSFARRRLKPATLREDAICGRGVYALAARFPGTLRCRPQRLQSASVELSIHRSGSVCPSGLSRRPRVALEDRRSVRKKTVSPGIPGNGKLSLPW